MNLAVSTILFGEHTTTFHSQLSFFHSKFASGKLILSVQNVVAVHARTLSFTR